MKERFVKDSGASVDLVKGHGGVFEIEIDGALAFSKKQLGRFPEESELARMTAGR